MVISSQLVANVLPIINLPLALKNLPIAANGLPLVPIGNDMREFISKISFPQHQKGVEETMICFI